MLAGLNPRHRRALLLKDYEGWAYEELAALEGTSAGAVRNLINRARSRFRELYETAALERGLRGAVLAPLAARWRRKVSALGDFLRQVPTNVGPGAAELCQAVLVLAVLATSTVSSSGGVEGQPSSVSLPPLSDSSTEVSGRVPAARGSAGGQADASAPTPKRDQISLEDVTDPNHNVRQPEDTHITSVVWSPRGDGVAFASGHNRSCATNVTCPAVLFMSNDGGASWKRLAARGFDATEIVLPPGFGVTDDRIFAMDRAGVLLVSSDGGRSFGPAVLGAPQLGGAMAISPAFNSGDPRILIGAQSTLMQYDDAAAAIAPAPYSSLPGSLRPSFATPDLIMVGGRVATESGGWASSVFRCEIALCATTRLPGQVEVPQIRVDRHFARSGTMFAFTSGDLFVSTDGAREFSALRGPWTLANLEDVAWDGGDEPLYTAVWSAERAGGRGLYTSLDLGNTWRRVPSPLFDRGASVVAVSGAHVIVALGPGGGLACSPDHGVTWARRC